MRGGIGADSPISHLRHLAEGGQKSGKKERIQIFLEPAFMDEWIPFGYVFVAR